MADTVGRFRSASSQEKFLRAFRVAMEAWPEHVDHQVETTFGMTVVSTTHSARDGDPLILLQGGGSTVASWVQFADSWRQDRPVIAIDTIWDAGRSVQTRPVITGADAARWLDETLAGLKVDHAHLVGYSYGAWIALNHVVHAPSRLLSVTAIEPPGAITGLPPQAWWQMVKMLFGDDQQYRAYLSWVRGGRLPESALLDVMLSARADFLQRGSPRPRCLTKDQWEKVRTPLMITLGGRSRFIPSRKAMSVVRRRAPDAQLHVLPESSHAVLADEPDFVIDHVRRFVQQHDRVQR